MRTKSKKNSLTALPLITQKNKKYLITNTYTRKSTKQQLTEKKSYI